MALRRAIALAFDAEAAVNIAMYGGAIAAQGVVPPGVAGYDAGFRTDALTQSLPRARALLDAYGCVDRNGDGFREDPNGKPLTIELMSYPEPRFVVWDELYAKTFAKAWHPAHHQEGAPVRGLLHAPGREASRSPKMPGIWIFRTARIFVILSGPASNNANTSHFALPAYDALFGHSRKPSDGAERNALYREMNRLMLCLHADHSPRLPAALGRGAAVVEILCAAYGAS